MASPVRASLGLATMLVVVPLAALAFGSFQGCTVLSNDDPLDEGGVYDGGEAGPDAALDCNECVIGSCSGEWATCFASADCVTVLVCVASASDATALAACSSCGNAAQTSGVNLFAMARRCDAPQRCGSGACNAACSAADATTDCKSASPTCGGGSTDAGDAGNTADASTDAGTSADGSAADAGDAGPAPVTAASCNTCIAQSCNDQKQQCPSGSDCDAYLTCALQCTTAGCITDCGTNHPTGKQASAQLAMCVNVSCTQPCGL